MDTLALEAERLAYGYPQRVVGEGFTFRVAPGDVTCVLGPNGCGKTTLFRTVLGLLPPKDGAIRIGGRAIADWSRGELAQAIGYVPQAHSGYFAFTVREIVLMGRTARLSLFGSPTRHDQAVCERVLHTLGIDHLADRVYTQVSGGERQLALIGRALAQEPRFLVLDEPTANLDFGNQILVLEQIRALAAHGIGVLFSTHDPDQAFICADHVLMLRDGHIVCAGHPTQAITTEHLRRVYGVDVNVVDVPLDASGATRKTCVPAVAGGRANP
ncbi:MAG TPA: ABC transporter ATP-binding protein [Pelomicrobium sp.]|nr:ABC transporter ATP-binding protein [Pelomicrobium sp.]